jgi:hypothetical protein
LGEKKGRRERGRKEGLLIQVSVTVMGLLSSIKDRGEIREGKVRK